MRPRMAGKNKGLMTALRGRLHEASLSLDEQSFEMRRNLFAAVRLIGCSNGKRKSAAPLELDIALAGRHQDA
jgi:hypothetical protein